MIRTLVLSALTSLLVSGGAYAQQSIGGCNVLPPDNIWNTPVDTLPVMTNSTSLVNTIGASRGFHADFGSGTWDGGPIGIPLVAVPGSQPKYQASFLYADESDTGPYAVPLDAPIEGGSSSTGDRHAIAIDTTNCILYELYRAFPGASSWTADSGAIFDLTSNALRPATWTSADAAGLPIMPGLVTYDEMASGEIKHAIRFTVPQTRREFVGPARHYASSLTGTQYPRMGERFRLKATYDISGYPSDVQVILRAMKKYGIILADNGSAWYISGRPDARWNNSNLATLGQVLGTNFEAVDATVLQIDPSSGAARQSGVSVTVAPAAATVRVGHGRQFSATVNGATGGVTWSVNDVNGGDVVVGTIDAAGLYFAPAVVPSPGSVTIKATSLSAPTAAGSAAVTVIPQPAISSVSPASVPTGAFTLTVNGAGYVSGSSVSFDGVSLPTSFVSPGVLTASGNAPVPKASVAVFVVTPDGASSNVVFVPIVLAAPVTVAISPTAATVKLRNSKQFTATLQGTSNSSIVWRVNGVVGGNSSVGTITQAGLYKAPNTVPSSKTVSVSATATADSTQTATALVTISKK